METYTTEQASKILHLNVETVRKYLRENKLHGIKLGGTWWRISREELERAISEGI